MTECLFCKIRDGQIAAKIVYRDDLCLAFEDIQPEAPTHLLLIPLRHIATTNDLTAPDRELIGHIILSAAKVARERGHAESGYRLVTNCNRDGVQTVFHLHFHLLAGRRFSWPPG